ncbi:MAG: hypothetical protein PUH24_06265 [Prevotellaceae bacterium]|nr:hypothetical protein [Prevotella sp.]MDD7257856.1 hypothetical protein [Prevotellaceae bacterium]MDY6130560.1 hypothetical protein [Prevotella sp.]
MRKSFGLKSNNYGSKVQSCKELQKTIPNKGKWYAHDVVDNVVGLDEISQEIQDNTTDRTHCKQFIRGIEVRMMPEKKTPNHGRL